MLQVVMIVVRFGGDQLSRNKIIYRRLLTRSKHLNPTQLREDATSNKGE
jgi:hypothetical protein